ncbi:MAG: GntR family transcriptional regulator [Desulfomonilia bacterium]|jgi:GntR family transcriptional repressor for pyruvate dehydrogenase complex
MAGRQVHQKVVNSLLRDIFSGRLRPGEKLSPERELSRAMNVDRTSLRVALKQLESMNLLDIRPGDGIYVKDYLKHAGIDFLRLLFSQTDEAIVELVSDKYVVDEIWEWWTVTFPEVLKLGSKRFSMRDLKEMGDLIEREAKNLDDLEQVVEIEVAQQDLVASVAKNMIFTLIFNSSRPLRKKIAEMFVRLVDRETLERFVLSKKEVLQYYLLNPDGDFDAMAEGYRQQIDQNRQAVRKKLFEST